MYTIDTCENIRNGLTVMHVLCVSVCVLGGDCKPNG